jgi:hypothetical protein
VVTDFSAEGGDSVFIWNVATNIPEDVEDHDVSVFTNILKMEAVCFSETFVLTYQTT